jgi:hypothetical protein
VIAYNCPDGCAADLAAAKALLTSGEIPPKAGCPGPPVVLTPDPTLQTPWAASAWHHVLRARCFDHDQFARFILDNQNHGPELFDGDCGAIDRETAGWCAPASP